MRSLLNVSFVCLGLLLTAVGATAADAVKPAATPAARSGKYFVQVYFEENFKGKSVRLEVPCEIPNGELLNKRGIPNDSIMSMKIPDGIVVTLYAASGFGGASQSFTGKAATLGELKGNASSIKAEVKAP
jgi:hypothetical protein